MTLPAPDNDSLLSTVRAWAARWYPGCPLISITIRLEGVRVPIRLGERLGVIPSLHTIAVPDHLAHQIPDHLAQQTDDWEPNEFQATILGLLEYRALRSDALWRELGCDRSRIWKKGGIKELEEHGLVHLDHSDKRLGYYRTDCPPAELAEAPEDE